MLIGERLRTLRAERKITQREIEKRTGLLRCYISRVENGHSVPAVGTLERFARALEVPMYQLFYEGNEPPKPPKLPKHKKGSEKVWGDSGKEARTLEKFRRLLGRAKETDRKLLLVIARMMARES